MSPIHPMSPILPPIVPVAPVLRSCFVHLLFDAAVAEELLLGPLQKALQKNVLLVDERDGDVRNGLIATVLDLIAVDSRVKMCATESARLTTARILVGPLRKITHTQIVLIVEEKLLQTGTVDIDEFNHHLHRRHTVTIPFRKILLP